MPRAPAAQADGLRGDEVEMFGHVSPFRRAPAVDSSTGHTNPVASGRRVGYVVSTPASPQAPPPPGRGVLCFWGLRSSGGARRSRASVGISFRCPACRRGDEKNPRRKRLCKGFQGLAISAESEEIARKLAPAAWFLLRWSRALAVNLRSTAAVDEVFSATPVRAPPRWMTSRSG